MKKLPVIGISANLLMIESGSFMGLKRSGVVDAYVQAVCLAGGVPLILPIVSKPALIQQQIDLIDGLILSGGYDVCPLFYREEPSKGLEAICPERDVYEIQLLQSMRMLRKPILGICRGLQLMNVALGGTLYQDIELFRPSSIQHQSKASPDAAIHSISILPNTLLHEMMSEETLLTNSFHHQAIKELSPELQANALSQDGLIEGIEGKDDQFLLGVQWHPELMIEKHPCMLKLFKGLIQSSKKRDHNG